MLQFVEISDANDELFQNWIDLYELAFPPEERVPVSWFLRLIGEKRQGLAPNSHIQAVLDESGAFVGLLRYDLGEQPAVGYLWYIAITPNARGAGIGSACFDEVVRRARKSGLRALIFEVEIPEHFDDPDRCENARRRIEFYRRLGAFLLTGIRYVQHVPNQPEVPLHVMVRPIEPINAVEAFEMARLVLEDVTQVGELALC